MRKIIKGLKVIWKAVDGRKLLIGTVLRFGLMTTHALSPDLMGDQLYTALLYGADALTGVGALHKIKKEVVPSKTEKK